MVVWPKLFCTLYLSVKDLDILHAFFFKFYMFIHLFFPLIYSFVVLVGCSLTRKIGVSFSFSKMIKKKKKKKKESFSQHTAAFHFKSSGPVSLDMANQLNNNQTNK